MMSVVSDAWEAELAPDKCWAVVHLERRGHYLLHFENHPAGDYHAACATLRHQGSGCGFPCLWCEVRNTGGNSRLCSLCDRYCCHHRPFSGACGSIVELECIPEEELAPEPAEHKSSIDASHSLLKPRRALAADSTSKRAALTARAQGTEEEPAPAAPQRTKRQGPRQGAGTTIPASGYRSPLDPNAAVFVHPHVRTLQYSGCSTCEINFRILGELRLNVRCCCSGAFTAKYFF